MATNIDELFKASGVGNKRKLEPLRDPNQAHKYARHNNNNTTGRPAHIEDEQQLIVEDDDNNNNIEAGPSPPPEEGEGEGDYGPEIPPDDDDDEEGGRFFGGGVTAQEVQLLDYVDAAAGPETTTTTADDKMDVAWLRRTALTFEKKISRNAEQRARFEDEPAKFIASEADLDAVIKTLSILSEHPELYPEFARIGCAGSLVGLLAHENTDIAIDAIEIINELTDEDVAAGEEQWDALVDSFFDADLLSLLVSNLGRLDETQETDRGGVYQALGVLENLCGRATAAERVAQEEGLLKWLLQRIQATEESVGQNKQYAAEILAILVQESALNRRRLCDGDAVDTILQLLAPYRKRNPEKGSEEEEYVQNLFDALTSIVDEPEGKTKFIEAEGVELALIMVKEAKKSKGPALKVLDHAVGGPAGVDVCMKIVEAGGLKNIFMGFMRKKLDQRMVEHLVDIFAEMLRRLPGGSDERVRLLAKFVEKDYEKTVKLLKLRREAVERIEWARLDARSEDRYIVKMIDIVLAWLIAEDDGTKKIIKILLAERDEKLDVIKKSLLEEIFSGMQPNEEDEDQDTQLMLRTLADHIK
ncbi:DUF1716-domain-containing protein [Poronia punctata]|nr:DUF1716-domain-containing protein [Poronia punctata]